MVRTRVRRSICRLTLTAISLVSAGLLPGLLGGCGTDEPDLTGEPVISPDGESVVTVKRSGDKLYVEQDGRPLPGRYDYLQRAIPTRRGPVFAARKGDKWVVMRGEERVGDEYDFVGGVTVGPEGEVAFIARVEEGQQIMREGEPVGKAYQRVGSPVFSPDGSVLAYIAEEGGTAFLVRDGVRQPGEYEEVERPRFGPDGESLTYVVQKGEHQQALMRDGERISPPVDGKIATWAISPDGETTVVVQRHQMQNYVIRNGTTIAGPLEADVMTPPVFAPDGRTVFYGAAEAGQSWVIYRDDQKFTDDIEAATLADLLVSPDGSSVACAAKRDGQWYVLKNGRVASDAFHKISNLRNGPAGDTFRFAGLLGSTVTEEEVEW